MLHYMTSCGIYPEFKLLHGGTIERHLKQLKVNCWGQQQKKFYWSFNCSLSFSRPNDLWWNCDGGRLSVIFCDLSLHPLHLLIYFDKLRLYLPIENTWGGVSVVLTWCSLREAGQALLVTLRGPLIAGVWYFSAWLLSLTEWGPCPSVLPCTMKHRFDSRAILL